MIIYTLKYKKYVRYIFFSPLDPGWEAEAEHWGSWGVRYPAHWERGLAADSTAPPGAERGHHGRRGTAAATTAANQGEKHSETLGMWTPWDQGKSVHIRRCSHKGVFTLGGVHIMMWTQ